MVACACSVSPKCSKWAYAAEFAAMLWRISMNNKKPEVGYHTSTRCALGVHLKTQSHYEQSSEYRQRYKVGTAPEGMRPVLMTLCVRKKHSATKWALLGPGCCCETYGRPLKEAGPSELSRPASVWAAATSGSLQQSSHPSRPMGDQCFWQETRACLHSEVLLSAQHNCLVAGTHLDRPCSFAIK